MEGTRASIARDPPWQPSPGPDANTFRLTDLLLFAFRLTDLLLFASRTARTCSRRSATGTFPAE
jgi:hypothetical protein